MDLAVTITIIICVFTPSCKHNLVFVEESVH